MEWMKDDVPQKDSRQANARKRSWYAEQGIVARTEADAAGAGTSQAVDNRAETTWLGD